MSEDVSVGNPVSRVAATIVAAVGRGVSWLLPILILVTFSVVILRYGMNLGWIWLQELIVYLHSAVFMLAAAWAFQVDEHVRVDIFYRGKSPRYQALVNLLGTSLLLVPYSIYLLWVGWEYVQASWMVFEGSREAGGLNFVYILKSLILALPVLLLLQSCDTISRCLAILKQKPAGVTAQSH